MTVVPTHASLPHAAVWRIAWPAMLTNVSVATIGMVDTWVAGQLGGAEPLAAVAAGSTLVTSLAWSFNFLRSGTTGLTAQAAGASDEIAVRLSLLRALAVAASLGLVLLALRPLILRFGEPLLGVTGEVAALTHDYAGMRLWAVPLMLANMAFMGWLLGQARARTVLAIEIGYNAANTILSLALGLWMGWGIEGIALASVLAEGLKLVVSAAVALRVGGVWTAPTRAAFWDPSAVRRLFSVNRDLFLRTLVLMVCLFWFTRAGALLGPAALAAQHIVMQFNYAAVWLLDGFESAAQVLGGQKLGAKDRPGFAAAGRACLLWGLVVALVLGGAFYISGGALIGLFTQDLFVMSAAVRVWPWLYVLPLAGFFCFVMDGLFIGAAWTGGMLAAMVLGAAAFAAVLIGVDGVHAPWLALLAMVIARGSLQAAMLSGQMRKSFGEGTI
jgi:multidrug resistance protein, MATE family